ncbi:hypothetical protein TNCV_380181 [Trichonephila clavipes]|nr:hypothetical protein TNCV_380181 [Trichonephila clavipes]
MYGHRVCIPEKYQNQVLEELHVGHPGIVKMKAIARSYCYWQAPYHPATNGQAERIVQLFKASLKSSRGDSGDLNVKLQRFLLHIQIGNEIWKRHVDQIRKCGKSIELSQAATEIPIYDKELNFPDEPVSDDVAESESPAPVPEVVPKPKDVPVPATPSDDIPPKMYQTLPESRKLMCHSDAQTESGDLQRDSTCDSIFCRGGTVMYLATARSENLPSCVTCAFFVYFFVFHSLIMYMFGVIVVLLVSACVS